MNSMTDSLELIVLDCRLYMLTPLDLVEEAVKVITKDQMTSHWLLVWQFCNTSVSWPSTPGIQYYRRGPLITLTSCTQARVFFYFFPSQGEWKTDVHM